MVALTLSMVCAALLLEAVAGYPRAVFLVVGHPVTWMGALIGWLERRMNRPSATFWARRMAGVAALVATLAVVATLTAPSFLLNGKAWGFAVTVVLAASLPAQRSLHAHVEAVAKALDDGGLDAGRIAVAMIVGRNPARLDEAGIARAAIESLAENFSDGVVAPAFWLALGGLPGGALYKTINTADSMIGHRTERYAAFGWAAARLDDFVNLPASRLSALWLICAAALTGGTPGDALRSVRRDAARHRSPNAGWPEAAMAGALGLQLAGPRVYGETLVDDAFMGSGRRTIGSADIRRALRLYRTACAVQLGFLFLLTAGLSWI